MGLSAYDDEGRLKKHALQGTGLGAATDQKSVVQRKQFETLHAEAAQKGMNEEQMTGALQNRMTKYSEMQQNRMGQIAERTGSLVDEYNETADPMAERFERYTSSTSRDAAFDAESKEAWLEAGGAWGDYDRRSLREEDGTDVQRAFKRELDQDMSNKKADAIERGFLKNEENRGLYSMLDDEELKDFRAAGAGPDGRLRTGARAAIARANRKHLEEFTKDRWTNLYDWHAEKRYNENRERVKDQLNKEYFPLIKESAERQERIEDRMELYNMFLGE